MRNKRFQLCDRRQDNDMPRVPFKDSKEETIRECRRSIPDRRISYIHTEWIDDVIVS